MLSVKMLITWPVFVVTGRAQNTMAWSIKDLTTDSVYLMTGTESVKDLMTISVQDCQECFSHTINAIYFIKLNHMIIEHISV